MTKSKKLSMFIFSLLLVLASLLFVACGSKDYSNTTLTSSESTIELFVGEQKNITLTINNPVDAMSKEFNLTFSNPQVCKLEQTASQEYSTTYTITGLKGGNTILDVATLEGGKKASITINVKQYSEKLEAGDNSLYVSASSNLTPSSADFVFENNSTERNLNFYFYGKATQSGNLILEDVMKDNQYINEFVNVELISVMDKNYLIFEDVAGKFYTLDRGAIVAGNNNVKYQFVEVQKTETGYEFNLDNVSSVSAGDEFTFIAKYQTNSEEQVFCERTFFVLVDINSDSISHTYGYQIENMDFSPGSDKSYKIEGLSEGEITLIPNYTSTIMNGQLIGEVARFNTVYLEVKIETTNDLLLMTSDGENDKVVNSTILGKTISNGWTTYYIQINSNTGNASSTNYNVTFYYKGFENSNDSNVNFTYTVPVDVRVIPTGLLVNNVDLNTYNKEYTFYNSYAGSSYGWQPFQFTVTPNGAEYESLLIDMRNSNLQLKYKNTVYTDQIVEITDLKDIVYIKGLDGAEVTNGIKKLPIQLDFNIIQEDFMLTEIKYEIVKGATILDFKTDEYKENVYLNINSKEPVQFKDLFADAEFSSIDFSLTSGMDVASFIYDKNAPYSLEGADYFLNFSLSPKQRGTGTYVVSLDNGKQISLTITVLETLNDVYVESTNEQRIIKNTINTPAQENKPASTLFYVFNKNNNGKFDIKVISNSDINSTAITSVETKLSNQLIQLGEATDNNKKFNVYIRANGSSQIELTVYGYEVKNFIRNEIALTYIIDIVAFDFIENLYVYKTQDGVETYPSKTNAAYGDVYINTSQLDARTLKLDFDVKNQDAYLFSNPATGEYIADTFGIEYLYWEIPDIEIYKNGTIVDKMYFSGTGTNIYTVGEIGTFDASNLTFTTYSQVENLSLSGFKLIAHVRQYGYTYSYTVNVRIRMYEEVSGVTLQNSNDDNTLEFSALEREKSLIAYAVNNKTATNPKIVAIFEGGEITVDGNKYKMFDAFTEENYIESDGKYQISLKVNDDFVKYAENYTDVMQGVLYIAAEDWLDETGNIKNDKKQDAISINVTFANGTENNRFTIKSADDLLAMKDNMSAHYQLKTTINVSLISSQLPLGELKGSIIGTNEYAIITGINITTPYEEVIDEFTKNYYYGLFSKIGEGAYINYITFEGEFNIGKASERNPNAYVGLVAGVNKGSLINVGVVINTSNIYISNGSVGGVVGHNEGLILQDFTLFDSNKSLTRSSEFDQFIKTAEGETKESIYSGLTPKITVFMNGFMNIYYTIDNNNLTVYTRIGGVAGYNIGTIRKIDVDKTTSTLRVNGYTNYMAYSLIKAIPDNVDIISRSYIGGLVGENSNILQDGVVAGGYIQGGYNVVEDESVVFKNYSSYQKVSAGGEGQEPQLEGDFVAGTGIVVGGEIWGYGYIGGVVGYIDMLEVSSAFAGITARAFVRGQKMNDNVANVAVIANIIKENGVLPAFAIQAVDDGKSGEESSMLILYNNALTEDLKKYLIDTDAFAFGLLGSAKIDVMSDFANLEEESNKGYENSLSYLISREQKKIADDEETISVEYSNNTIYYGDVVIVASSNGIKTVVGQGFLKYGNEQDLSLSANFNNRMISDEDNNYEIYYMYYFKAGSVVGDIDIADAQLNLDTYLNKINASNKNLYPFIVNGEMTFTSKNQDILTIDQSGRITVKKTGLAQISGSSVLNSNNALTFYIYVVNYFNSESTQEEKDKTSIIYPVASTISVPLDDSTIELRGNNSATIYVMPKYDLDLQLSSTSNSRFVSDRNGKVSLNGIVFNLAGNDNVSAEVTEETDNIDINVIGSAITLRKKAHTAEHYYSLNIKPRLELSITEGNKKIVYFSYVNKMLTQTKVDYKYGALSMDNIKYNEVTIHTSKIIKDEIIIESTDGEIDENGSPNEKPLYYMVDFNNQNIQGDVEGLGYKYSEGDQLFNVEFKYDSTEKNDNGIYYHKYKLNISINRNSNAYLNRYTENVYGEYTLNLQASSNSGITKTIKVVFEKTNVNSIVVDNYTTLKDATNNNGLSSVSEYAYPGVSGLLSITITPEDSDFDFILIENVDENYTPGKASANFGFLARKNTEGLDGDAELFDNENILGSSTAKGIRLSQEDIINVYGKTSENGKNLYEKYNGIVYIQYDMGTENVIDESISSIRISLIKDGEISYSVVKNLKIKLQNFVTVELDGKEGQYNQDGYYAIYEVARGLKYKLNINNYGFDINNVQLSILDSSLGTIVKENGDYYLQITSDAVDYTDENSCSFDILISATEEDGEVTRSASSKTKIIVNEYVVSYNSANVNNPDIIENMGEGIVNVQVGTQTTFAIDIYDYIEYDSTNNEVVSKINQFMTELSKKGKWTAYTNLISDMQPDYGAADDEENFPEDRKTYDLGFIKNTGEANKGENYYFDYEGLNVLPSKTHNPTDSFYYFVYEGAFKKVNGVYTFDDSKDPHKSNIIKTKFTLNVFTSSSEESPIPVYDYKDFIGMQEGGYYILLNDITLPNTTNDDGSIVAFTPLNGNFASFDGNGHTISLSGTYDMGELSEFGIFSSLNDGSIIKNLNVNYTSANDGSDMNTDPNDKTYDLFGLKTIKFVTTASSFTFGGIVANNSGIITNCHVYTDDNVSEYYITVKADSALDSTSYIGGLVGNNSGYITNSTVSINVKSPYNTAGVVATNSGKVAGCYFKEGKLINNSQFDQHIAGFVISNSESGQILTSYVAGGQSNTSIYSKDMNSYISSTLASAGFVYQNAGIISDCYTDIDLSKTTSDMAGFAFYNSGHIENSFSLSVLRNNVTASAGFARFNNQEGTIGTFANCYYFYNERRSESQPDEGFIIGEGDINTSLVQVDYEGIEKLNAGGFANVEENFESYSYQLNMGTNAVWFFSKGNTSSTYVDYIPTTDKITIEGEDGQTQTNTIYRTENKVFGLNRLELINPNISALSIKNFSYSQVDNITGDILYYYVDDSSAPNRGSIHNPRLIYNAKTMESEILEQTSSAGLNIINYRMISDVDYSDFEGLSNMYTVTFAGILEGNGMEISSVTMATMEKMNKAGLFGQIGYSASRTGTVKNLTIIPKQVAFTNTNNVGVLTGVLKYGSVYDVSVKTSEGGEIPTVSGMNFVGGIIGKAISSYTIKDVYSSINVSASYSPQSDASYDETFSGDGNFSYAGGIAGFLGTGTLYNAHVDSVTSIMGGKAGFAYGGLGRSANVNYTYVDVATGSSIKAYNYGGYITGETAGNLSYSYVSDNTATESTFSVVPRAATGVGGISGLMLGGTIDNAVMKQDFRVVGANSNNMAIKYVGGIVGLISTQTSVTSTIRNCIVESDILSSAIVGGAVGQVSSAAKLDSIAVKSKSLTVQGQIADPVLGGIVGNVESRRNSSVSLSNSYCTADLFVYTSTSGIKSTANIGGLIGNTERLPELYYCYTTSKIEAEVYDSRSLDGIQDFENYLLKEDDKDEKPPYFQNAVFTYDTQLSNAENVYFFGYGSEGNLSVSGGNKDEKSAYPNHHGSFVNFKTKVKGTSIGVKVNNYGQSSYNLITGNADKTALNEIFALEYDYKITDSLLMGGLKRKIENGKVVYTGNVNSKVVNFNASDDITKFKAEISSETQGFSSDYFIDSDNNNLSVEYKLSNNGVVKYNQSDKYFSIGKGKYICDTNTQGDNAGKVKLTNKNNANDIIYDTLTVTYTLDTTKLIQKEVLRNSAGEDFKHQMEAIGEKGKEKVYEVLINLSTGAKYAKVKDVYRSVVGSSVSEEAPELKNVPTQKLWVINSANFTTLAFENNLDWINRK